MKRFNIFRLFILLGVLCSCETYNEEEMICLPVNMTATVIQGTETKKIIADYNYVPGTNRLDHITWSNHQTHYFEYDESERMLVVRQMKVDVKIQEEKWFIYNGSLVEKIILVKRNLDYIYLEPVDSVYVGYIEFEYEGKHIVEERRYEESKDENMMEVVWKVEYEYDSNGNILSASASDPRTVSVNSMTMTYDNNRHPFSDLQYYFTGESFVNNQVSKYLGEEDFSYSYDIELNEYGFPEIIYEKLGLTHSRIIRYSYLSL